MRLIYENGRKVGPDPAGFYVYHWRHAGVVRYVGKGVNGRWAAHAKLDMSEAVRKREYFARHLPEMECLVVADGLTEAEAGEREVADIRLYRLIDDGGTLLNSVIGAIGCGSRIRGETPWQGLPDYYRLYKRLAKEGHVTPNAVITRLIKENPKKPGSRGVPRITTNFLIFELYPPVGVPVTVGDHLAKAEAKGYGRTRIKGDLAYDLCRGYIRIDLPEGERVFPGHIIPTKALLDRLTREIESGEAAR
jgi:hypothetical protein